MGNPVFPGRQPLPKIIGPEFTAEAYRDKYPYDMPAPDDPADVRHSLFVDTPNLRIALGDALQASRAGVDSAIVTMRDKLGQQYERRLADLDEARQVYEDVFARQQVIAETITHYQQLLEGMLHESYDAVNYHSDRMAVLATDIHALESDIASSRIRGNAVSPTGMTDGEKITDQGIQSTRRGLNIFRSRTDNRGVETDVATDTTPTCDSMDIETAVSIDEKSELVEELKRELRNHQILLDSNTRTRDEYIRQLLVLRGITFEFVEFCAALTTEARSNLRATTISDVPVTYKPGEDVVRKILEEVDSERWRAYDPYIVYTDDEPTPPTAVATDIANRVNKLGGQIRQTILGQRQLNVTGSKSE